MHQKITESGNFLVHWDETGGALSKERRGKEKEGGGVDKVKNSVIHADIMALQGKY